MQALREQRVHYEVGWTQRLAHQKSPIDRVEFHVINASYLYVWSVGLFPVMLEYRRKGHCEIYK